MTSDWLSGGLIVALAAVLWLIYLLPTWFRRNEYLSTERNVVRLQQTLRILAETSEVPDEVYVEANARSVAEQQRILKKAKAQHLLAEREGLQTLIEQGRSAEAAAAREAALTAALLRERALTAARTSTGEDGDHETIVLEPIHTPEPLTAETLRVALQALRRSRAGASGILLLALVVAVLGGVQIAVNGAWIVLVVGVLASTLCVTRLARLARDGRALRARAIEAGVLGEAMSSVVADGAAGAWAGSAAAGTSGAWAGPAAAARSAGAGPARAATAGAALAGAGSAGAGSARAASSAGRPAFGDSAIFEEGSAEFARFEGLAGQNVASVDAAESHGGLTDQAGTVLRPAQPGEDGSSSGWVPVPLPKPLAVGNRRIDGGEPVARYVEQTALQAEQALRAAARDAERALRAAQAATDARGAAERYADEDVAGEGVADRDGAGQGARIDASAAAGADRTSFGGIPNRFASMGVIDDTATGAIDVDRVLARRRAG